MPTTPAAKVRPRIPTEISVEFDPFVIDTTGRASVIGDIHFPHHDRRTVEAFVKDAKRNRSRVVVLNGDTLDFHKISRFERNPLAARVADEIRMAREFLAYLREQLGAKVRIVWKDGNHDERFAKYIADAAPELVGLDGLDLPSFLHLGDTGTEYVTDKRVIWLGKLNLLHGHEFGGGAAEPVSPAKTLYVRTKASAACNHHHRISSHYERDIRGKPHATWSVGCACKLNPSYRPINQWENGYAVVEVSADGRFHFENRHVYPGAK